jgi:hypothetical protein
METAHWNPASGTRRGVRARPTQGRVAPAKGNAKLPERPQDEGGPREARPASLHGLVGHVPEHLCRVGVDSHLVMSVQPTPTRTVVRPSRSAKETVMPPP